MKNVLSVAFLFCVLTATAQNSSEDAHKRLLQTGWQMQSSLSVSEKGGAVSKPGFATSGWFPVEVPSTIIGGLLKNNQFAFDPFYGKNFEKIRGREYDSAWWFRKEFSLTSDEKNKTVTLRIHGINYRANVWLNGTLIAGDKQIAGPFRIFELDITKYIKPGANALAFEITRPFNPNKRGGDLAIDYADWIHYPADYNGGIVNNISLGFCDKVAIRYPLVTTKFDLPSLSVAHLQVDAVLTNYSDSAENVEVKGSINREVHFMQQVHLNPKETRSITFTPDKYPQLNIKNPKIWWPWEYGEPALNEISLRVIKNEAVSDVVEDSFGIREVTSRLIDNRSREFSINGKPVMLRGAAWSPDIFQRRSKELQEQEIRLARDMNMNLIRSEGKLEDDHFYDLCNKYGMMVMTGYMCCGAWQYPERWDEAKRNIAMSSDSSIMYWLRNKACIIVWLNGSDMPPRDTTVERDYLKIEKDLKWPNPIIATANEGVSKVSGYSGVKMDGPYEWVPPIYWETDSEKYGGAYSFATEISPGPSIPPYESLIKFIPEDSLSVHNSAWLYHAGTMQFGNTDIFAEALNNRYGKSDSIKEFVAKAQAQNYESHRAMMEAYGLHKYNTATGIVQWMLNNPWPGLIWHTFDYYLYPAGTYFGIKKALEPLHIQYSYKTREVSLVNSLLQNFKGLTAKAAIYNMDGSLKYSDSVRTDIAGDGIKKCFVIPAVNGLDSLYFLRLQLTEADGNTASINWYWLSKRKDVLNWNKSTWYYTPQTSFTDFSILGNLQLTTLDISPTSGKNEDSVETNIKITNTGASVAFFVHVRALDKKGGSDILPVIFDDNYLLLAPGESRTVNCRYASKDSEAEKPFITISGWNIDARQNGDSNDYSVMQGF